MQSTAKALKIVLIGTTDQFARTARINLKKSDHLNMFAITGHVCMFQKTRFTEGTRRANQGNCQFPAFRGGHICFFDLEKCILASHVISRFVLLRPRKPNNVVFENMTNKQVWRQLAPWYTIVNPY